MQNIEFLDRDSIITIRFVSQKQKGGNVFLGSGKDITEWLFVRGVEVVDYTIYIFFETIIRSLHTFLYLCILLFSLWTLTKLT